MRALRFFFGLAVALVVLALGQRVHSGFTLVVDPVLVLVLVHSLWSRPGWDVLGGSVAGLAHDSLAGGIYGQMGFVNTVAAYICSQLRHQLVIQRPARLALFFALLALVQQTLLAGVRFLLLADAALAPWWSVLAKMVTTGILGATLMAAGGRARAGAERRRERRRRKLKI